MAVLRIVVRKRIRLHVQYAFGGAAMQCACDIFAVLMEASEVEVTSATGGLCLPSMLRHGCVDQVAWLMFARQELDTSIDMNADAAQQNTKQHTEATRADKMDDARHNTNQPFTNAPPVEKDYILLYRQGGGVLQDANTPKTFCRTASKATARTFARGSPC